MEDLPSRAFDVNSFRCTA